MTDKKLLLGSFCREESPRLCDHSLLSNATRATRPCAPSESYITSGPALTILQVRLYNPCEFLLSKLRKKIQILKCALMNLVINKINKDRLTLYSKL